MGESTTTLTELTFAELTSRLASRDPVPGGGSTAALAGAMAAALVSMVAELTPSSDEAARLGATARERATQLGELAQQDADAYAAVVAARKLPRETDEQRLAQSAAVRNAMREAAAAPMAAARAASAVLELVEQLAPIGNVNAASDIGVAGQLAAAAVRGALLNVRINLPFLSPDDALRANLPSEIRRLEEEADAREDRIDALVAERLEPA